MTDRPKPTPAAGPPSIFPDVCQGMVNPQTFRRGEMEKSVGGMTLREHFAGQALQGLLSSRPSLTTRAAAETACNYADALLAELAKPAEGK